MSPQTQIARINAILIIMLGHDSMTHDINIDPVGVNYGHLSWHITRHVQAVAAVKQAVTAVTRHAPSNFCFHSPPL